MKFWYPVKIIEDTPLPGLGGVKRPHPEIQGVGHLLVEDPIHGDKFLCGKSEYAVLRELNLTKKIVRENIILKSDICQECQEAYKSLPQGPWRKWIGK